MGKKAFATPQFHAVALLGQDYMSFVVYKLAVVQAR